MIDLAPTSLEIRLFSHGRCREGSVVCAGASWLQSSCSPRRSEDLTQLHVFCVPASDVADWDGFTCIAWPRYPLKDPGHRHWLAGDWQGLSHSSESDAERGTSISLVTSGSTLFGMRPPRLPLQTFSDNWHFDGQFSPNYLKAAAELSSRAESVGMRSQATGLPTPGATPRAQGRM